MGTGPESLTTAELAALVRRVFAPRPEDERLAILVDLPDAVRPDNPGWAARRRLAADWATRLGASRDELGFESVQLVVYRNVRANNAELPRWAWCVDAEKLPATADQLEGPGIEFAELLGRHRIVIAPTELSATAPLKLLARRYLFRAATMPGFNPAMIPALRVDQQEVHRRCEALRERFDRASTATLVMATAGREHTLTLDLRHRRATASSGLLHEPGTAGNLPSGETYIVPYEGERPGDPSRSEGMLPLQLEGELLHLRIERNRVVEVLGDGPVAARERSAFIEEPAYANVAELGVGVLAEFGLHAIGEILLDEKLGLHVAFGRSDHFPGGTVGPDAFSSPDRVVHIDRVYLPELQPDVRVVGWSTD